MIHMKGIARKPIRVLLCFVLSFTIAPRCFALTLEEAISLALMNLPAYQAVLKRVQSSDALYKASYGPYLPSVDVGGSQQWHDTSTSNYDSDQQRCLGFSHSLRRV